MSLRKQDGDWGRNLAEEYIVPPFTVLDTRKGGWRKRKQAWVGLGVGVGSYTEAPPTRDELLFSDFHSSGYRRGHPLTAMQQKTSEFDPVLAEILTHWFSPPGGRVLDPFAGGVVRGAVAAKRGREYVGIDLRPEQVEQNREQWKGIASDGDPTPEWIVGDAVDALDEVEGEFDMVLTCPPYGSLEKYSDDPKDLSNLTHAGFIEAMDAVVLKAADKLKDGGLWTIVISDFRDSKGAYRGFPQDVYRAGIEAGMVLYNELILINRIGSAPVRARPTFRRRKTVRTHQTVLVFLKGGLPEPWVECDAPHFPDEADRDLIGDLFG